MTAFWPWSGPIPGRSWSYCWSFLATVQVGRLAAEAGVKCLVLTHFYPEVEGTDVAGQVGKHFKGKVVLAEDLMTFSIEDS